MNRSMCKSLSFLVFLLIFSALAACSSSDDPITIEDGDTNNPDGDTGEPDGDTDDPDGDTGDPDGDEEPSVCGENEDGCCTTNADCTEGECFDNICIIIPSEVATVWWEDSEYNPETGDMEGEYKQLFNNDNSPMAPNLDCDWDLQDTDNAGTLTVKGTIKVFGVEAPCQNIIVEVFDYNVGGAVRSNFPEEDILATAAVVDPPDADFRCHLDIPDVPKGKWLIFKTYDKQGERINVDFRDTFQYDVYIKPEESNDYEMEIQAITHSSWQMIPLTAGVSNGIQNNRGALAGSVKDCDGRLIKGATVGTSIIPTKLAYFNATVHNLLPNPALKASNSDSTFSGVNMPEGNLRIVSLARIDGQTVTKIADFTINMNKQTVSIYGIHGPGPTNYGMGSYKPPAE